MPETTPAAQRPLRFRRGRLSIRWLMFVLVLAVLLPTTGVSVWFLGIQSRQAARAAETEVRQLANSTAAALELILGDQQAVMKRLAERPQVMTLDADNFDRGVVEFLRVHPEFNNLAVRDREARLVFRGRPGPDVAPERVREFAWFKEGLANEGFLAGDAHLGNLSGRWVTELTHPVRDARGGVAGLLNLSQDLLTLNERVMRSVPAAAVVAVTDRQGRYLLRSADAANWVGKPGPSRAQQDTEGQTEGFLSATGPDGVTRLYAFVTIAQSGWRVIAGLPEDLVFADSRALLRRSALIGAAILLLGLLAAWQVGRRIVVPIDALADAAVRQAGGETLARAPVQGPAEIRAVALEFNQMVEARAAGEQALRDSERSLAITLQSIGDAVIATDLQGRITRMNPTAEQLTGWPLKDAAGRPLPEVFRIVQSDTREASVDPARRVLESANVVGLVNHTALLARDGAEHQIASSAAPIRDDAGRTVGVVLVFSEVSERYRAEQALRASAEVLSRRDRALAEISQGVMMTDAQARITYVNPGFERLTGYSQAEVLGRTCRFLQGPETSAQTVAELNRAVRAGEGFHGDILNRRKDGTRLWLALDISPLHDEQGVLTGFVGAQRDITERMQSETARRALESQLREAQKMESIGTLAGGIAHDFNNILGAILGNLALAHDAIEISHPAQHSLQQIQQASLRARDLVQQILAFSRRQTQALAVQPLNPILQETQALLRSALPAMVELRVQLPSAPLHVDTNATQMQQVLMNLCTNAWHALAGSSGRVELGLDEQVLDGAAAGALGGLAAGHYAHVWVRDTGTGMDEATRVRMFEPFFTTKAVGEGTGLGLSVVHGIVKLQHGGLGVTSEPGKGTTVDLYFPLCAPLPVAPAPMPSVAGGLQGRGERVLYVDDDEAVRLVAQRLLQRAGLRVQVMASADEVLRAVAEAPAGFDLVVTDFNMPGASGLDLARELGRSRPDLPVIITSGYVSDGLREGASDASVRHLLQKQNLFEELVPLVLRVLAEHPGPRGA